MSKYKFDLAPKVKGIVEWHLEHYHEDKAQLESLKNDMVPSPMLIAVSGYLLWCCRAVALQFVKNFHLGGAFVFNNRTNLRVPMLGFSLDFGNRWSVVFRKMCNSISFRSMWCFRVRSAHSCFCHKITSTIECPKRFEI